MAAGAPRSTASTAAAPTRVAVGLSAELRGTFAAAAARRDDASEGEAQHQERQGAHAGSSRALRPTVNANGLILRVRDAKSPRPAPPCSASQPTST